MRKSIKRIFSFILSIALIFTSMQLTGVVDNEIEAVAYPNSITYGCINNVQTYTIPSTGYYIVEVAGGKGGDDTTDGYQTSNTNDYLGGYGGYVEAKMYFTQGTVLYIYVGGAGGNGGLDNETHAPGYNGGGSGYGARTGDGGGATDIRIGGTALTNRIIVAGGGGGGTASYPGIGGGAGESGNNNILGQGSSAYSTGGGGGGGYYGGTPGAARSTSAKGGSNYFNTSYGTLMSNKKNYNDGSGYCIITKVENYSLTVDPNGGIYEGTSDNTYYQKDTISMASVSKSFSFTGA